MLSSATVTETSILAEAWVEQRAFRREHAAGAYSFGAYHMQWAVRLCAQSVWKALLFGSFIYWWPYQFNPTADGFFYFLANYAMLASMGAAFSLLIISFIPDPEGAATTHNAIMAVLLQFCGFYLPACFMPPLVNVPYFLSPCKYAFEGLIQNEFRGALGSTWSWYQDQSLDPNFSRWTNLLALGVYPFLFHALASAFTFLHTRPQSFWTQFDSASAKEAREQRARLGMGTTTSRGEKVEGGGSASPSGHGGSSRFQVATVSSE